MKLTKEQALDIAKKCNDESKKYPITLRKLQKPKKINKREK